jgi:hypothetical protein
MAVHHVNNGDGSVTQFDSDTGQELVTFLDQDGSFTRDYLAPAAAAPPQDAPRGANLDAMRRAAGEQTPTQTVTPERTTVTPAPQLTPTESEFQRHLAGKGVLETAGVSIPESEPAAAPLATPAPPQGRPGMVVAATRTEGLSPESQAAAEQSRLNVTAAQEDADQATTDSEQAQLDASAQRIQAESERRLGQASADAEMADLAQKKLGEAQEFSRQARAAPISPQQALGGDKFFFAILANVGAALSNFGSALLGQGPTMDPNVVDDIIAESVRQQTEQKRLNVDGADQALEGARSDQLRAEIKANASLEKWFEAQSSVEKLPEVRAAYSANAAQRAAAREEKTRQLAETEWSKEAVERTRPKPTAPVIPLNPETAAEQAVLAQNGVADKAYRKYTNERVKTGVDAFLQTADDAESTITRLTEGQDVPGSGPLDRLLQPVTREGDAAAVQQASGMLTAQFGKLISGASMTDAERKNLVKLVEGRGTLDDWKRGIQLLRNHGTAQLETLNTGYPGESRAYDAIKGMRQGRKGISDEQRSRRDRQLGGTKPAPVAEAPAAAPERPSASAGRSLDSITGQDEVRYEAEQRKKKRDADATREERRNRLSRFLQ